MCSFLRVLGASRPLLLEDCCPKAENREKDWGNIATSSSLQVLDPVVDMPAHAYLRLEN